MPAATVLAVDPDPAFAMDVAGVLDPREVFHVDSLEEAAEVIHTFGPVVVILGADVDFEEGLLFIEDARADGANVGAVAIARRPSTTMMRQAMYAGVTDVLASRWEPEHLQEAVARAEPVAQVRASATAPTSTRGTDGQVVTIFSAKGGCGKSTVATNLAVLLGQRGHRVCILDLDLQFGDACIMFQVQPSLTIRDVVQSFDDLDAEAITDFVTVHESGVALLPGPLLPAQADEISASDVERVIGLLRQAYDWVIVDTPAAFNDQTLAAIDEADRLVVLSSFDVPSIKNLRIGLSTLRELGVEPAMTEVVMVRADAKVGLRLKEVERTIGVQVDVAIPSDRDVTISLNHGIPLALERPRSPVVQAMAQLADRIAGTSSTPAEEGVAPAMGRLRRRRAQLPVPNLEG